MAARTEGGLSVLWDAPLVRKLDGATHRKNHYPVTEPKGVILWIGNYQADSVIHLLNN